MKTHELKTLKPYFEAQMFGWKAFEVRRNDRDFNVGDDLVLREIDSQGSYTGRSIVVRVSYILGNEFEGVVPGYVVMSTNLVKLGSNCMDEYFEQE